MERDLLLAVIDAISVKFAEFLRDGTGSQVEFFCLLIEGWRSLDIDKFLSREVERWRSLDVDKFLSLLVEGWRSLDGSRIIGFAFVECFRLEAGEANKATVSMNDVRGRFPSAEQTLHAGFVHAGEVSRFFGDGDRSRREECEERVGRKEVDGCLNVSCADRF